MTHTIVVVEDDEEIAAVVRLYLEAAEYDVVHFSDGTGVSAWIREHAPSVLLLDLDLPVLTGIEVCKQVRAFSAIPIIMTTAKVEEVERLTGLETGADDYVCKPYSVKELVARVKVQLRRLPATRIHEKCRINEFQLDESTYQATYSDHTVQLSAVEFRLFQLLYLHPGRIYSRQQIIESVYQDYREISDRTVDSHIRNLRKKLTPLNPQHDFIQSLYGVGYKYQPYGM